MSEPTAVSPLPGSVEYWAQQTPGNRAVCEVERALTWAQWNEAADRIAEAMHSLGCVGPDDRVAVCMRNRLEWFVCQAAIAKLDASLVPVSWRLTPAEVHYIVADSGAKVFAFDDEDVDSVARVWTNEPRGEKSSAVGVVLSVAPTDRTDLLRFSDVGENGPHVVRFSRRSPRSIIYTSGTTGRPRGVVNRRRELAQSESGEKRRRPVRKIPELARNLLGAPLNHAAAQATARATLAGGGCVYLMPRFEAEEALKIIDREKITTSFLVPTMLNRIVNLPKDVLAAYDVSSIRILTTGASPCPQSVKQQVIGYFGDHCLFESYGSTEVGLVTRMLPQDHLRKPGSCGRIFPNVDVRIVGEDGRVLGPGETGEIFVKAPVMIESYLNEGSPQELHDGYFATGDVGRVDDEGFLFIVDRKKDMIIAGGVNIYPAEIEDALRQHPHVLDAAVFGIPHREWGEEVKAVVECVEGRVVSEAELLDFVSSRLASYKRPRSIDFVDELPRNPAGKLLKAIMRAPYWAGGDKTI